MFTCVCLILVFLLFSIFCVAFHFFYRPLAFLALRCIHPHAFLCFCYTVFYAVLSVISFYYFYFFFLGAMQICIVRTSYGNVSVWVAGWLSVTAGIVSKRLNLS